MLNRQPWPLLARGALVAIALLAVVLTTIPDAAPVAANHLDPRPTDTHSYNVTFQTRNQSMCGPGGATPDSTSVFLTPTE